MMTMWIFLYWLVGFIGALIARYFLEYGTSHGLKYVPAKPLSRGGMILCAFGGFAAPLAWMAVIIWGLLYLSKVSNSPASGRITAWLSTPVVRKP